MDGNAGAIVARNQVPGTGLPTTNHVARCADFHTRPVADGERAGGVGPDVVASYEIAAVDIEDDAIAKPAIDYQTSHCAVAGRNDETASCGPRQAPIEHDQGIASEAWLSAAVNHHRVSDLWQRRGRLNCLYPSAA